MDNKIAILESRIEQLESEKAELQKTKELYNKALIKTNRLMSVFAVGTEKHLQMTSVKNYNFKESLLHEDFINQKKENELLFDKFVKGEK